MHHLRRATPAIAPVITPGRHGRRRAAATRLRAAVLAALLTLAAAAVVGTGSAAAWTPPRPAVVPGSTYLALGDSVTFGYQEKTVVPPPNYHNAASFLGYPEHLRAMLKLKVANASCPGETSASLINAAAPSNGCENGPTTPHSGYRTQYPLHTSYKGSQLAFAINYLRTHRNVRLVSLMIGANDLFRCQSTTKDGCLSPSEQAAVMARLRANIHTILSGIRNRAHYRGQLVIVNYYSLNYASPLLSGFSKELNAAQDTAAKPFGVEVAAGYRKFQRAALHFGGNTCTAGLLTEWVSPSTSKPTCGVHPSYAGQALLAEAVAQAIHL